MRSACGDSKCRRGAEERTPAPRVQQERANVYLPPDLAFAVRPLDEPPLLPDDEPAEPDEPLAELPPRV